MILDIDSRYICEIFYFMKALQNDLRNCRVSKLSVNDHSSLVGDRLQSMTWLSNIILLLNFGRTTENLLQRRSSHNRATIVPEGKI